MIFYPTLDKAERISTELTCPTKLDATAVEYYNSTAIKLQILLVWQGSKQRNSRGNTCYQSGGERRGGGQGKAAATASQQQQMIW
jgi:hypothetical protein